MNAEQIFHDALDRPPAERPAFLAAICAGDEPLRRRVEALLHAHENPGSFLAERPPFPAGTVDEPLGERPGTLIGPYKLLQQIGEGGMGTVFMAEQSQPVKRLVALKIIKPGMDSKQVLARFEAERQALALMDHPNIAKVLDAGTTAEGRPYFVMELVKGVPITKFCDDQRLTPRQRLELFVPICHAVQHAHQKGIIHRDLKPSNVLVCIYDGKPAPKVIDFGVAKAAGPKLTERTLYTEFGAIVGTLEYMSPEQAQLDQLDVDTRSDIYSLGVLLYELLTGTTPLERKRLKEVAILELLRLVREEESPRPSTRLSSTEALPSIAANRGTEPKKLSGLMRRELDWIVMKSLEKDRNRRYETANGLAHDIERYLNDEAVLACPPSAGYRLRKFMRRRKGTVLGVSLVTLALVGGVIGTTWGMLLARSAEADAKREAGEKTVALGEKEAALATAKANETAAKVAQKDAQENLKDALAAVDQMLTRVADDKLLYVPQMEPIRRDLLLDALKFYQKFRVRQTDDPLIRRELILAHRRVGGIRRQLGQDQDAEAAFRTAIDMFGTLGGSAFVEPAFLRIMVDCHIEASWALGSLGKNEEAHQYLRGAAELAGKLDKDVPVNRRCILNTRNYLARALISRQPEEAEKILKENLALADDAYGFEAAYRGLAEVFMFTRRLPEAEGAARQALKYAEQLAGEFPSANWVQGCLTSDQRALARVLAADQRPAEAEETQRRAVGLLDKLAADFPSGPGYRQAFADALIEEAGLLKQLERPEDAEKAHRRAFDIYDKLARDFLALPGYRQIARDQRLKLAKLMQDAGKIDEARLMLRRAIDHFEKLAGDFPKAPEYRLELAHSHNQLGHFLWKDRRPQEGEKECRKALELFKSLATEFPNNAEYRVHVAHCHSQLAGFFSGNNQPEEAENAYHLAIDVFEKLVPEYPSQTSYRAELAWNCGRLGLYWLSLNWNPAFEELAGRV